MVDDFPMASPPLVDSFVDITDYWGQAAIQALFTRQVVAGYPDGTVRPNALLTRAEFATLLSKIFLDQWPWSGAIARRSFNDLSPQHWADEAIQWAVHHQLLAGYEDQTFRPDQTISRAQVLVVLVAGLRLDRSSMGDERPIALLNLFFDDAGAIPTDDQNAIAIATVNRLVVNYPDVRRLHPQQPITRGEAMVCLAQALPDTLLTANPTDFKLDQARDRTAVFEYFSTQTQGFNAEKLAFLDRGIAMSPHRSQIVAFPDRLKEIPDEREVINSCWPSGWHLQPYPELGQCPAIDESGLSFLHADIQQACVCLGQWRHGQLQTRWLGRNAMQPIELWSTTKLIPLLNVVAQVNRRFPGIDIDDCQIRQQGTVSGFSVYQLAQDIMSYDTTIGTSNAIAAMMKLFETPAGLEGWLQSITGHQALEFRGGYGEPPFLTQPELWHPQTGRVLLRSHPLPQWRDNTIAVYDLTRLVSMVGWHLHLPTTAQLPGVQWNSLECVVRAMGCDSARYIDVAMAHLGLESVVRSPVIISKLGYGRTSIRDRAELAYTALVQFVDTRPNGKGRPGEMHSMALTMLSAKDYGNFDQEAVELDARMATEVTELMRRLIQVDWD